MQSDVLGKNNPNYTYILTGSQFAIATQWQDLGVTADSFLEVSAECSVVVKKTNSMLGRRKVIENQTENITALPQNSAVNPLIKYCAQFWPSRLEQDMVKAEKKVQREQVILSLEWLPQTNKLNSLDFFRFENRWLRRNTREADRVMWGI